MGCGPVPRAMSRTVVIGGDRLLELDRRSWSPPRPACASPMSSELHPVLARVGRDAELRRGARSRRPPARSTPRLMMRRRDVIFTLAASTRGPPASATSVGSAGGCATSPGCGVSWRSAAEQRREQRTAQQLLDRRSRDVRSAARARSAPAADRRSPTRSRRRRRRPDVDARPRRRARPRWDPRGRARRSRRTSSAWGARSISSSAANSRNASQISARLLLQCAARESASRRVSHLVVARARRLRARRGCAAVIAEILRRRLAGPQQQLDGLRHARERRIQLRPGARIGNGRHRTRRGTRGSARRRARRSACRRSRSSAKVKPSSSLCLSYHLPRSTHAADVEMQLVAGRVERESRLHDELAPLVEADVESPHHAFAVQPGVVQANLAARIGLRRLEVVDAEQHAEVVLQRRVRIRRQRCRRRSRARRCRIRSRRLSRAVVAMESPRSCRRERR